MGLNANQKRAVEYLDGPLLVLAGPGTGKTQLLSHKVAYILQNTDTNPENILCLTFTESGTSNMRERLKTVIGSDANKVNIGTYHAFGSDILAQYKNYADNYDRKLDSAIDEVVQYKIIKNIQSHLNATDILRGDNVKDIIGVISSAKSANLSASDLAQIAEQNIADSKILSEAISPLLQNVVPRKFEESLQNAYQPIYDILKPYDEIPPILKTIDRSIKSLSSDLKTAICEATTSGKVTPLTAWRDLYFEKDEKGNYRLRDRIANKKLQSIACIMQQYDAYLKDHNMYDFDDMIQEAVRVLREDNGFRLTLSERYQFILLDEFQDTNPSQFEIIKQLTAYEKPMLMAVGDDDQAIYEFQGASATNLTEFQAYYNAEVIPLVENYRSTQEILDFSRKIINQANNRFADKELIAHKEPLPSTGISRHEFISSDAEYAWVSDQIAQLIKNGVKQSEIAVISYKTKYFMPLLPFLKSHPEINIAYEKRDNLFENPQIHQLLTLARFIDEIIENKAPQTNLLEILSYPFWQLPMLEVVRTISRAHNDHKAPLDYVAESDNPELQRIANFFADLTAKAINEPLEIFLDYLIGTVELNDYRSPFLSYYASEPGYSTFSFYENLASLRGKLNKYFADRTPKLADLIEMVDDYMAAEMPLNISSPYHDTTDAVQIMTAHKSKGLEFEYVFIISADHTAWGKGKGNNNLLSLPKNLIQIRHTGTTDEEKLRILYVALTRAKKSLIITNAIKDFNDKSPERLEYLDEHLDDDKQIISPFIPSQKVESHYEIVAGAQNTENLKNWLTPYVTLSPDMRAIYQKRIENYRMSASSLTSFIDIVYAGPVEFFKRQILRAPEGPTTESLSLGNLVHKTFEEITNKNISNDEAIEFFMKELEKEEVDSETKQKLRESGPKTLATSLENFGEILRAGKAEVNLGPEKLVIAGIPVTGAIDHIQIDEENKTIEIYDFKTSAYHKEKWESQPTLYKYMLQLGFYKLLLNASPTYSKYKITRAHILFVTPDKDEEVHDKIYEFNDQDEQALITLMQAVYAEVSSLNFIDDAELFIQPNNELGIKDIKSFIELVLAKAPQLS